MPAAPGYRSAPPAPRRGSRRTSHARAGSACSPAGRTAQRLSHRHLLAQPVVCRPAQWLVGVTGTVQSGEEEVTRAVPGEHPPRAVAAVGGRGEAHEDEAGVRVAKAGQGRGPSSARRRATPADWSGLLPPGHQPGTTRAPGDFATYLVEYADGRSHSQKATVSVVPSSRRKPPRPTVVCFVRHGTTATTGKVLPGRARGFICPTRAATRQPRRARPFHPDHCFGRLLLSAGAHARDRPGNLHPRGQASSDRAGPSRVRLRDLDGRVARPAAQAARMADGATLAIGFPLPRGRVVRRVAVAHVRHRGEDLRPLIPARSSWLSRTPIASKSCWRASSVCPSTSSSASWSPHVRSPLSCTAPRLRPWSRWAQPAARLACCQAGR